MSEVKEIKKVPVVLAQLRTKKPLLDRTEKPKKVSLNRKAIEFVTITKKVELFHDQDNNTYVTFSNKNKKAVTCSIDDDNFAKWVGHEFYQAFSADDNNVLSETNMKTCLGMLKAIASEEGECCEVYQRVGMNNGNIYIDLANDAYENIEISTNGWKINNNYSMKFKRNSNMRALPTPTSGGNIDDLLDYTNIPADKWKIVLAWIIQNYLLGSAFPILSFSGLQGTAKSTTQECIKMLIDPSANNLTTAPKKAEDLF